MPEPLQKQILLRLGLGAIFLVSLTVLIVAVGDMYLWLPCAGAVVFFFAAAFILFRRAVLGEYVVVDGICAEVGTTAIKRRSKFLILHAESTAVKVLLHSRLKQIPIGTEIKLYISKNTPVYKQNGLQILYTYIAIDVK